VQRWFVKRRGFASGLAVSGIGVGTLVFPPLAAWLIDAFGWRPAYLVLAGITLVVGGGMALLLVDHPHERGLAADGAPLAPGAALHARAEPPGMTLREALRSRGFIVLYSASLISSFGVFVPFVHLVPYAVDHGVTREVAALLVGVIGVGSTAGRFVLGGVADRMGRSRALTVMFLAMGGSLAVWYVSTTVWALAAFAFLYGVSYGGWVAVMPSVVMDLFGGRAVSSIIGVLYSSVALGTLVGPTAAGYAFDVAGSYTLPILIAVAANVVAAAVMQLSPSPSR
jgi:predicted MFS family arabinose efflux permease